MNSPEDFPGYLSAKDTKKWFLKPETFTCPSGYITGITVNWGKVNIIRPECIIYDKEIEIPPGCYGKTNTTELYETGMYKIDIICSDGTTGSLGHSKLSIPSSFITPSSYTIQNPLGIKELTIYEGNNEIYSINGHGLGKKGTAATFSCPTGNVINSISILQPYKYANYTYTYPFISGFNFGCVEQEIKPAVVSFTAGPSAVTYTQPSPSSQKTPLLPSTSVTTTKSSSKTALIIFLSILFAVIIIGAIGLYYHIKRTKKRMREAKKVLI